MYLSYAVKSMIFVIFFLPSSFTEPIIFNLLKNHSPHDCVGGGRIGGHYTTYECAVHGVGSQHDLIALRKKRGNTTLTIPGPRPKKYAGELKLNSF